MKNKDKDTLDRSNPLGLSEEELEYRRLIEEAMNGNLDDSYLTGAKKEIKITPLADKTSEEYQKAYNEGAIVENERNSKVDPLIESLEQAEHLKADNKKRMIEIAALYLDDMRSNIFSDQFDLHDEYPSVSIDEWNDFLADRIVSTYISKHKRTLLKNKAESSLATPSSKNKRDSLQLLREMESKDKDDTVNNVVIIRIPVADEDVVTDTEI